MQKKIAIIISVVLVAGTALTAFFYNMVMDISQPYTINKKLSEQNQHKKVLFLGVISRYPPNIILKGYQPLIEYLTSETGYRFELKFSTAYQQTVKQLIDGEVDAAFFGTYLYVKTHKQYGVLPIVRPLNENFEPYFKSVVIVRNSSDINSIKDLKGRRLALPAKESFSGNWLTMYEIKKYGLTRSDLGEITNFAHHNTVIYQVLRGNYDAGVVKEYVANQYLNKGIRIIGYSVSIPGSPIVVRKDCSPEIISAIQTALLKINAKEQGHHRMLENWDQEFKHGFSEAEDSDYDMIRQVIGQEAEL